MKILQSLRDLSIGRKIGGLVLFLTLITAIIGGVGLDRMQAVGGRLNDLVEGGLPLTTALRRAEVGHLEQGVLLERALRLPYMLISGKKERLAAIREDFEVAGDRARAALRDGRAYLDALDAPKAAKLRKSLTNIEDLLDAYAEKARRVFDVIRETSSPQLARKEVPAVREADAALGKALDGLVEEIGAFTRGTAEETAALKRSGLAVIAGVAVVGLGAALVFGLWLALGVSRPLRQAHETITEVARSGDLSLRLPVRGRDEIGRLAADFNRLVEEFQAFVAKVGGKTGQLAGASEQLEETAEEIAGNAQSSSANADHVSGNAREVNGVVQEVAREISSVSESAEETAATTREGRETLQEAGRQLERLRGSTSRVEEINASIAAIAKQTDLLALNAAIEAANAGEAGKGFAVVADEVRKLAEHTAQATGQVREIVHELEAQSETSTRTMEQVQGVMDRVQGAVEHTRESANRIAASAEELAATMGETTENMAEINAGVESVAGSVDRIQEATGELGGLSQELRASIRRFQAAA
ncbi:methyl-accepting chemotaxis protein [Thiohalorhabdus sp. Cl-TMA]|uniref:Methyl-accepting chemotaxis protein n=1 Tax=Thiohalorhabdus methylotrophus TaxID=3242694 RepID=A0ABV4TTL5_9GAMM